MNGDQNLHRRGEKKSRGGYHTKTSRNTNFWGFTGDLWEIIKRMYWKRGGGAEKIE